MTDELAIKKQQLRAMKHEARNRLGKYTWGDHHRRQSITKLENDIRKLKSLPNVNSPPTGDPGCPNSNKNGVAR